MLENNICSPSPRFFLFATLAVFVCLCVCVVLKEQRRSRGEREQPGAVCPSHFYQCLISTTQTLRVTHDSKPADMGTGLNISTRKNTETRRRIFL